MASKKPQPFLDKHSNVQAVLIGLTVVMFWRGAWGLMDLYLFPGNQKMSYVVSLLIGLLLLFVLNHHRLKNLS